MANLVNEINALYQYYNSLRRQYKMEDDENGRAKFDAYSIVTEDLKFILKKYNKL